MLGLPNLRLRRHAQESPPSQRSGAMLTYPDVCSAEGTETGHLLLATPILGGNAKGPPPGRNLNAQAFLE